MLQWRWHASRARCTQLQSTVHEAYQSLQVQSDQSSVQITTAKEEVQGLESKVKAHIEETGQLRRELRSATNTIKDLEGQIAQIEAKAEADKQAASNQVEVLQEELRKTEVGV